MTGYWMQVRRVDGFYTLKAVFHRLLSTIVVRYRLLYEFCCVWLDFVRLLALNLNLGCSAARLQTFTAVTNCKDAYGYL